MIVVTLRGRPEGRKQPVPQVVMEGPKGRKRVVFKNGHPLVILRPDAGTAAYQKALALQAKVVMGARPLMTGALVVVVTSIFRVPSSWSVKERDAALAGVVRPTGKPDWDNLGKQLDAFKGVVWDDDAAIVDGRSVKWYGEEPMLRVEVSNAMPPLMAVGLEGADAV